MLGVRRGEDGEEQEPLAGSAGLVRESGYNFSALRDLKDPFGE